jgi:hypothetical protein
MDMKYTIITRLIIGHKDTCPDRPPEGGAISVQVINPEPLFSEKTGCSSRKN